jgi:hypothetical protein
MAGASLAAILAGCAAPDVGTNPLRFMDKYDQG